MVCSLENDESSSCLHDGELTADDTFPIQNKTNAKSTLEENKPNKVRNVLDETCFSSNCHFHL